MATGEAAAATTINILHGEDTSKAANTSTAVPTAPPPPTATARVTPFAAIKSFGQARGGWKRGMALVDFLLRLLALAATISATVSMGTDDETLPFFTHHFQFYATFSDFDAYTFFVVGNAIAGAYFALSLLFSIVGIIRPHLIGLRVLLIIFDVVMVALTTAAGASAAAVVYLAHTGIEKANWVPICRQFHDFCRQSSGAVVVSFLGTLITMMMVFLAVLTMRRH